MSEYWKGLKYRCYEVFTSAQAVSKRIAMELVRNWQTGNRPGQRKL